jgi:hypothetical protein
MSNVPVIASAQSFRNQNTAQINMNNNTTTAEQSPVYGNTFNNNHVITSQTPEYYR